MESGHEEEKKKKKKEEGMFGIFIRTRHHHHPLRSLFNRRSTKFKNNSNSNDDCFSPDSNSNSNSPRPIPQLSSLANSVVSRCSKIIKVPTEELQHRYDIDLPESVKQLLTYARNFVEFCSYEALQVGTRRADYLNDKDFRQLTFDMMLAWESPCVHIEPQPKEDTSVDDKDQDEDGSSLFYSTSTNMAVQVDDAQTVGQEAFTRIAPACAAIADIITVHNLFDALTSSSGGRLHFLIYDKYLRSLDKIIRSAKNHPGIFVSNLQLADGEIIIDVDGTIPTQPVLQHMGISAWPGRLTLTNFALYFESLGVGLYDKAVRYDLAADMKQVLKAELTGPLGARLFDRAVMYNSTSVKETIFFEFPEFKGNSRRDYWLDICLEILHAHVYIRKNNFGETQRLEVLARAILGIFRCRAVREAFQFLSSHYKTLLSFKLAENLPGGDRVLEALSSRLELVNTSPMRRNDEGSTRGKRQVKLASVAFMTLSQLGFVLKKENDLEGKAIAFGELCAGETNPLETAVKMSVLDTGRVEAAQATIEKVKVEGIDTNVAVMKELLFPVTEVACGLQLLASWDNPLKSTLFLAMSCFAILRGWTRYILALVCACFSVVMLFRRHFSKEAQIEAFRVTAPPNKNAVEQLLVLQEVLSQFEGLVQAGNITLLKLRALLFAVLPQATERVAISLIVLAGMIVFVPLKYIILLVFVEAFTRKMPYRKESSKRYLRRLREWWVRIPAAPVQLIKPDNKKKQNKWKN